MGIEVRDVSLLQEEAEREEEEGCAVVGVDEEEREEEEGVEKIVVEE